jgi:hypothetical protein
VRRIRHGQHDDLTLPCGTEIIESANRISAKFGIEFSGGGSGFLRRARANEDGVPGFGPAQAEAGAFVAGAAEDGEGFNG